MRSTIGSTPSIASLQNVRNSKPCNRVLFVSIHVFERVWAASQVIRSRLTQEISHTPQHAQTGWNVRILAPYLFGPYVTNDTNTSNKQQATSNKPSQAKPSQCNNQIHGYWFVPRNQLHGLDLLYNTNQLMTWRYSPRREPNRGVSPSYRKNNKITRKGLARN